MYEPHVVTCSDGTIVGWVFIPGTLTPHSHAGWAANSGTLRVGNTAVVFWLCRTKHLLERELYNSLFRKQTRSSSLVNPVLSVSGIFSMIFVDAVVGR